MIYILINKYIYIYIYCIYITYIYIYIYIYYTILLFVTYQMKFSLVELFLSFWIITSSKCRNGSSEVFQRIDLKNFTKFSGKYLCQNLFLNEVPTWRIATLLKQKLRHSCFQEHLFCRTSANGCFWKTNELWIQMVLLKTLLIIYPKNVKQNIAKKVCSRSAN